MSTPDYLRRVDPADSRLAAELIRLHSMAFGSPEADIAAWHQEVGAERMRWAEADGEVAGSVVLVDMGQFFGGRSVPMCGVAGVAVAPQHRGKGIALRMMRESLRLMHGAGAAVSTLYPATQHLYRRAGYEQGGAYFEWSVPLRAIDVRGETLDLRPVGPDDQDAISEVYVRCASRMPGNLDRGAYIWSRIHRPRGRSTRAFGAYRGERLEGYIVYEQERNGERFDIRVTDMIAATGDAGRTLLMLLRDHRSVGERVYWNAGALDPIVLHLTEQPLSVSFKDYWMLRIVDVERALSARGYPMGLSAELHFEISDDLIEANRGAFVVEVERGEAMVRRGGRGSIRLDVRNLAPLYTGHAGASALAGCGRIEADPAGLALCDAAFAGPGPWMPDFF